MHYIYVGVKDLTKSKEVSVLSSGRRCSILVLNVDISLSPGLALQGNNLKDEAWCWGFPCTACLYSLPGNDTILPMTVFSQG